MSSTVLQVAPAAVQEQPTGDGGVAAYFQFHGAMAPGVKLFRSIGFRVKAVIISAVFLLPIVVLGIDFLKSKADAIAFSAEERLGVAYLRDAMPLLKLAQLQRMHALQAQATGRTPPEMAQVESALDAQHRKLDATERAIGATLDTAKALADAKAAARVAPGDTLEKSFAAHNAHANAVIDLISHAADGSNLTLDPDLDTFYLMEAATGTLPVLIESVGKLRGLGAAVAASGKPASTDAGRELFAAEAVGDMMDDRFVIALDKVYKLHPEYRVEFNVDAARSAMHAFHELVHDGKADAATLIAKGTAAMEMFFAAQEKMLNRLDELLAARLDAARMQRNATLVTVSGALLVAAYLFHSFYLVTHGGLAEVRRHLEAMTAGDLTSSPSPWGRDEAAQLMITLREMQASLRDIVSRVRGSSDSIVHAASEIAAASMDLSARTEQTAANLEESASSMEEIASTVRHTADNSLQAASVAEGNARVAERGGRVIDEVVATMREIHGSSSKISEIIGVIDSIAFQTNILALNASVEAARAGEQGRGFAVVAGEVRQLAQRSAEAAREIKTLITSSVEKVESGTKVVHGAGETMKELVTNARRMRELMAEISTAASEQSAGVNQVGSAVQDLDRMTQQNAALVEESAAAAAGLKDQAIGLAAQVAKFHLPALH